MISKVFCSWIVVFSVIISNSVSEALRHHRPSAVVVGSVYCDTCSRQDFSDQDAHSLSGASVAVECGAGRRRPSFRREVKTNDGGEFMVRLPFSVAKGAKKIRGCSVKLISSGEPRCAVASGAGDTASLSLKERNEGTHVFSAGFFTFRPLKMPELCNQKNPFIAPAEPGRKARVEQVGPSIFPPFGILPPNPLLPPPTIIPPIIPSPPPSIFPPFFPAPPPSIFPPIFPQPPSPPPSIFPPLFPPPSTTPPSIFPPIPGIIPTPSPPPPPPPFFPFPLPPFPFKPSPGNPPPFTSSSAQNNSP